MQELQLPLLVVAPHPDDASLACAGLMQVARGGVYVVHVTAGDGFWRDAAEIDETLTPTPQQYLALGAMRMQEAHEAAAVLGVPRDRQYALGFPDCAMMRVVTTGTVPVRSHTTGRAAVPYRDAVSYGAPYTGASLRAVLQEVIAAVQPAMVAYPAEYDANSDHRAVGLAVQGALGATWQGTHLTYLVHHDLYPGVGLDWDRTLRIPDDLPPADTEVRLSRVQEHAKEAAIAVHQSQERVLGPWLQAFVATNEPFWSAGGAAA